jgi:hypothetical protein
MRALRVSPAIVPAVGAAENATSGPPICNASASPFFPFPDSLSRFVPSDVDNACFRPGYVYGDGDSADAECFNPAPRAPLLAVHAARDVLDQGNAQGWWQRLRYANAENASLPEIKRIATPSNKPYATAKQCSEACVPADDCGGFSFTHGVCLLRGKVYQPAVVAGQAYTINASCPSPNAAVSSDVLTGPAWQSRPSTCFRIDRTIPQPAKSWFDQCDTARCTKTEDVGIHGNWLTWNLPAPFEQGTRDFAFQAKPEHTSASTKTCYFPVYNRTEIRAMLGGEGAARSTGLETWVIVAGGSNSFGMGGAVMKAVHNTGNNDGDGSGISKQESSGMNIWQTNCLVDTIRFVDGTTKIRKLPKGCPGIGAIDGGLGDDTAAKLLDYLKDWDVDFKPGAIRVTHMSLFL